MSNIFCAVCSKNSILMDPCIVDYPVEIPTICSFVIEFIISKFLKTQHVSSGTPLIIRSSKLYLQPLVYMPIWWTAVAKLKNFEIINSITKLHLVGISTLCFTCLGHIRHSVLSGQSIITLLIIILHSVSTSYVVMPKRIVIICICRIEHSRAGLEEGRSISGMGMAETYTL
jgi:hypothetical protein